MPADCASPHQALAQPLDLFGVGEVAQANGLQGHGTANARIPGKVDDAHCAAPEFAFHFVSPDLLHPRRYRSDDCAKRLKNKGENEPEMARCHGVAWSNAVWLRSRRSPPSSKSSSRAFAKTREGLTREAQRPLAGKKTIDADRTRRTGIPC
ncbi:MAG: hypothetical protein U5J83_01455 [Bryobacterales bacterium]|nr:hypothetical protein [Bryobacterales bacterium]